MNTCEILLTKDSYDQEDWRRFVLATAKQIGGISPFTLVVSMEDKKLRFFIESKADIAGLSSTEEGFLLLPVESVNLQPPDDAGKTGLIKLPSGGNIIDIIEQNKLKDAREIQLIRLSVRRIADKLNSTMTVAINLGGRHLFSKQHLALFPAHFFKLNLLESQNYIFSTLPYYVSLEKTLNLLQTDKTNALFSVQGFPYSVNDYYLSLGSYQFDKHSLIVGASGSGKSKLIQLLVDRIGDFGNARDAYRVVVIDPHASLDEDLQHIAGSKIINLGNESAQLFPDSNADISAATELTTTLFQSLLTSQYNPRLERVLRFSVYVLLTAQIMTLDNLKIFLIDLDTRLQVLEHVQGYVPQNIQQFFTNDFNELRTQFYNEAILPIVSLVDEMQLQPSLVGEAEKSLAKTINDNFLSVFSLNKVSMGEKAVKTVAGLLIQQIFLIAQARTVPYKLILIIDEVSVVQNLALASILSEARKFNLSVIITQQYLSQVDSSIRDSILGNVVNYYVFRVSEEDASYLQGNMTIEIPNEIIEKERAKGLDESKIKMKLLTSQSVRDCLIRVSANGQIMPAIKATTIDTSDLALHHNNNNTLETRAVHRLPPKLMLENQGSVSASMRNIANQSYPETKDEYSAVRAEIKPLDADLEQPSMINIQQILADQSSSRVSTKRRIDNE